MTAGENERPGQSPGTTAGAHARGPDDAPVTLLMYGDYECPYCARAHPAIGEVLERAGEGRVRFVFRHFPLYGVHPHASRAAEAAEAAGAQGYFWRMHDLLYDNQDALADEDLKGYAARLCLDLRRFTEDLGEHRHAEKVEGDRAAGEEGGVTGTPALFVNGARYEGPLEVGGILEAVEAAARSAGAEQRSGTGSGPGRGVRRGARPDLLEEICSERRGVDTANLRRVVELAVEIAREGREGRKIGTLFVVGDSAEVMGSSRPMILDPLAGHPDEARRITDPDLRETIKELAQLDGAFVVSDEGVVLSAARYIDAVSDSLEVPLGLGSRHMAGASVSERTDAVAVVVSESSTVRMFDDGEMVAEIVPELWMFDGYASGYSPNTVPGGPRDGSNERYGREEPAR